INSKGENKLGHTAPFPEDIPEFAIEMFSYKGEYVLDPFAGSFTSVIVANKLDRVGIGIELNKATFRNSIIANINNKLQTNIEEFDI
ncbi:MAG: site-specific DNA-methyltransferase, partial [Rickettsiales bacterium]|nr:site-specific DNA-methyltransferase [Rickettsiales bacterium]